MDPTPDAPEGAATVDERTEGRRQDDEPTLPGAQALAARPLGPGLEAAERLPPQAVPAFPAPRWVELSEITDTETFRLREVAAEGPLAESIARHGQREPVDLWRRGGALVLLSGHRRLAAVRLLHRSRILGRIHEGLGEDDALDLALADDLDRRPWTRAEREALRETLAERGGVPARIAALVDSADAQAAPSGPAEDEGPAEEEVELEELAARVRDRLADDCNDVAVVFEMWADLDEGRRDDIVECVRYLRDLYPLMTGEDDEA